MPRPSRPQAVADRADTEQSTLIAPDPTLKPETKIPELTEADRKQEIRFIGNGIAYCKTCVRALQTDTDNTPICPIGKVGCDRNKR